MPPIFPMVRYRHFVLSGRRSLPDARRVHRAGPVQDLYERIHAPTIGSSFGAGGILIASIIFFSILQSKPILHEVLIAVFVIVTTPVTLMLLSRAVIHRDRTQDSKELPSSSDPL